MIAWAGMEMYELGWESEVSCRALRKWDMGNVLGEEEGVGGWRRRRVGWVGREG